MPNLALAKQHLRVENDDEDTLIGVYLAAAVRSVENYTGTKLTRGEVTQEQAELTTYLALLWGPNPDGLTITYTDSAGQDGSIADARLVKDRAYSPLAGWPETSDYHPVTLTYTAGWAEEPSDLTAAVLLLIGDYYANREAGVASGTTTRAVEALCNPYRAMMA